MSESAPPPPPPHPAYGGPVLPPLPPPAPPPPPRRTWLVVVVALTVAAMVVVLALAVPLGVRAVRDATAPDLGDVSFFRDRDLDPTHTDRQVRYEPVPPVGGPHDPAWHECGVYDQQLRDENVVHSLEHGTVWITYDPDEVTEADLDSLAADLPERGILSPYPGQDAPVIVTVWARQLDLDGADDERLALFLAEYADGHTAPEPFASCAGGVRRLESEDVEESGGIQV